MQKGLIPALIFALSLIVSGTISHASYAEEEVINGTVTADETEDYTDASREATGYDASPATIERQSETSDSMPNETEAGEPMLINETEGEALPNDEENGSEESISTELEEVEHNGTSGEGEVICADATEPGCESELDPELWPLIISLSALGVCIVFVIIINLVGRKHKV